MGFDDPSSTFREAVNALCAALPGAEWSESFGPGHDVWKVGGEMFAAMGALDPGVSVKTPDVGAASPPIDVGLGGRARCVHRPWIRPPEGAGEAGLSRRIEASRDVVRAGLPAREAR